MEPVKVAIIYYSSTGTMHALARAAADGAEKASAEKSLNSPRRDTVRTIATGRSCI